MQQQLSAIAGEALRNLATSTTMLASEAHMEPDVGYDLDVRARWTQPPVERLTPPAPETDAGVFGPLGGRANRPSGHSCPPANLAPAPAASRTGVLMTVSPPPPDGVERVHEVRVTPRIKKRNRGACRPRRKNCTQVGPLRRGTGSMWRRRGMFYTEMGKTATPTLAHSRTMRRYLNERSRRPRPASHFTVSPGSPRRRGWKGRFQCRRAVRDASATACPA